jgi:hypothetical protein
MPKKTKKEEETAAIETGAKPLEPVAVTVSHEHIAEPHSIELRRDGEGLVIDARTEDWNHVYTVGAKTVENILRESGAELPTGDEEMQITFSPHNGEVVAVQRKKKTVLEVPVS